MVYRFNRGKNKYNVVDMLMGPNDRASLANHILLGMALLSCWVVIDREMDGKDDVSTILLGVLGIFVTQKIASIVADATNKPTESSTVTTTQASTIETAVLIPPKKGK